MDTTQHTASTAPKVVASPDSKLNPSAWLNGIPAVAQYTGCSRRTVQNWLSSGELPVKRLSSRHLLIRTVDVDELISRLDEEYRARTAYDEGRLS